MSCEGKQLGRKVILKQSKHLILEERELAQRAAKSLTQPWYPQPLCPERGTSCPGALRGTEEPLSSDSGRSWLHNRWAPELPPHSMAARSPSAQTLHLIAFCQEHLAIQTFCQKLLAIQTFSRKMHVLFWNPFSYFRERGGGRKGFINLCFLLSWWALVHLHVTTAGLNNWILYISMNLQNNKSNVGSVGMRVHGFSFFLLIKNHLLSMHNAEPSCYPVVGQEYAYFLRTVQNKYCIL